jgi:hypothetical protein
MKASKANTIRKKTAINLVLLVAREALKPAVLMMLFNTFVATWLQVQNISFIAAWAVIFAVDVFKDNNYLSWVRSQDLVLWRVNKWFYLQDIIGYTCIFLSCFAFRFW